MQQYIVAHCQNAQKCIKLHATKFQKKFLALYTRTCHKYKVHSFNHRNVGQRCTLTRSGCLIEHRHRLVHRPWLTLRRSFIVDVDDDDDDDDDVLRLAVWRQDWNHTDTRCNWPVHCARHCCGTGKDSQRTLSQQVSIFVHFLLLSVFCRPTWYQ